MCARHLFGRDVCVNGWGEGGCDVGENRRQCVSCCGVAEGEVWYLGKN